MSIESEITRTFKSDENGDCNSQKNKNNIFKEI